MQLEELLNSSTKNVAQEVVTCLIPRRGEGVLVTLEGHLPNHQMAAPAKNKLMTKAHRSSASQGYMSSNGPESNHRISSTSANQHNHHVGKPPSTHQIPQLSSSSHQRSDSTHLPMINQRTSPIKAAAGVGSSQTATEAAALTLSGSGTVTADN